MSVPPAKGSRIPLKRMTVQNLDFVCVLSYNYIYEKLCLVCIVLYGAENVFQVLWFYYVLAVLASAGLILFRLAVCASPALRCRILLPRRVAATKKICRCIRNGTVRHSM